MVAWLVARAMAGPVAVVVDGPTPSLELAGALQDELTLLGADLTVAPGDLYGGASTMERLQADLKAALARREIDAVVALGPLASLAAHELRRPRVPVLAAVDLTQQPAPEGVWALPLSLDLQQAVEVVESLTGGKAALVAPPFLVESGLLPEEVVPATASVALPDDVRGLVVLPTPSTMDDEMPALYEAWTERGLATLALQGDLESGATGTLRTPAGANMVLRRIAVVLSDLENGRRPTVRGLTLHMTELQFSAAALDKLDIMPPFSVLAEADVVGVQDRWPALTLQDAVGQAILASPSLSGTRAELSADDTAVAQSVAAWLPAVDASLSVSQNDPRSVSALQPVGSASAALTTSQLLFSDGAVVNVNMQRDLRQGRSAELRAAEQDLAYDVASAYVGMLRAEAVIEVRRADLQRMRESLRVSRERQSAGSVAASEVARWQSEVASAQSNLVTAWTDLQTAQIGLQQLLGGDTAQRVRSVPLDNLVQVLGDLLSSPGQARIIALGLAEFSEGSAPTLQQLDATVRAQGRYASSQRRQYWMPTVAGQFTLTGNLYQNFIEDDGTTATPTAFAGAFDGLVVEQPPVTWSVGASVSLPILEGGALRASQREAERDLVSLNYQREALRQSVVARAHNAINQATAASIRADLGRQQVVAVQRTLSAALDSYVRGATTQTTVTEARTSALSAELGAANAAFDAVQAVFDVMYVAGALPTPADPEAPRRLQEALTLALEAE